MKTSYRYVFLIVCTVFKMYFLVVKMLNDPKKIARKRFMMFSCTIMSREEHIKSRRKSERTIECKCGIEERWSPMAIIELNNKSF